MMHSRLISFLMLVTLAACAGNPPTTTEADVARQIERYRALANEATPADWKAGAVWTFVTTDRRGNKETFTFRVSDAKAKTCTSGDWRELDLVEGNLGPILGTPSQPAALVEGRNLWINLTSNWCDIDNDLKGELEGSTFTGKRSTGGLTGSTQIGQIQGRRIE